MIVIKITLLFAIDLINGGKSDKKKTKNKNGRKSKKSSPRSKKSKKTKSKRTSSKKSKNSSKSSKSARKKKTTSSLASSEVPEHVIIVDKPIGNYRVEYQLIPKQFKYKFDIICWGPVVKVTTVDGSRFFRTVIRDNLIWVSVPIEHFLSALTTPELLELLQHVITFNITNGKKKKKSASKTKSTKFFLRKEEISDEFPEVFMVDPNVYLDYVDHMEELEREKLIREIQKIILDCINRPGSKKEAITSLPSMSNKVHSFIALKIIRKITNGEKVKCKIYENANERPKSKKKSKKKKNSSSLLVPAQTLFTDPVLSTYGIQKLSGNIAQAFVLISCHNLLTLKQKLELSPLVIKVHTMNNVPVDTLKQHGFEYIFITCDVPKFFTFKSKAVPIDEKTEIHEAVFYPTKNLSHLSIMEALATQHIIFEINGIRPSKISNPPKQKSKGSKKGKKGKRGSKGKSSSAKSSRTSRSKSSKSSKKGSKSKSKSKTSSKSSKKSKSSKSTSPPNTETVVLATVPYDFSALLKPTWSMKEKGQCHNPNILLCQKRKELLSFYSLADRLTVNDVNLIRDSQRTNTSPLTEDVLLMKTTNLKVEAYCLPPLYATDHSRSISRPYKRLLLIVFNADVAKVLINDVYLHNQQISGHDTIIPNVIVKINPKHVIPNIPADFEALLSGFFLDCGDHCMIFMEGLCDGYILKLIHKVSDFNISNAKVFYNSDHQFESRLYPAFLVFGGFYSIIIKLPLQEIFSRQKIYLEGNLPCLSWRGLKKIQLIYTSINFKSILQYEILPTESELLSFSLEFGFQLKYRSNESYADSVSSLVSKTKTMMSVVFSISNHTQITGLDEYGKT